MTEHKRKIKSFINNDSDVVYDEREDERIRRKKNFTRIAIAFWVFIILAMIGILTFKVWLFEQH
jgi:hypothetical protein